MDVAAPPEALIDIWEAITAGALNFSFESVAFKLDLLRLRAVTVVDRGSDGEVDDFRWLL